MPWACSCDYENPDPTCVLNLDKKAVVRLKREKAECLEMLRELLDIVGEHECSQWQPIKAECYGCQKHKEMQRLLARLEGGE